MRPDWSKPSLSPDRGGLSQTTTKEGKMIKFKNEWKLNDPDDHEIRYTNISSKKEMLLPVAEYWAPARDIKDKRGLIGDKGFVIEGVGTDDDYNAGCDVWQWIWKFRNGFGVSLSSNETNRSDHWGAMDAGVIYFENLDAGDRDINFREFALLQKMDSYDNNYIDIDLAEGEVQYGYRRQKDSVHKNKKNLDREDIEGVIFENILDDLPSWNTHRGHIGRAVASIFCPEFQKALQEVKAL